MKMIKFKYTPSDDMTLLIMNNISEFNGQSLTGFMPEGIFSQLNHYGIYLVCEEINNIKNSNVILTNPLAIVARNDVEATITYTDITGRQSTTLCELEHDASKAKVESYE